MKPTLSDIWIDEEGHEHPIIAQVGSKCGKNEMVVPNCCLLCPMVQCFSSVYWHTNATVEQRAAFDRIWLPQEIARLEAMMVGPNHLFGGTWDGCEFDWIEPALIECRKRLEEIS